jgi:ABC-type sugar transport system ATPase subunit
VQKIENLGWGRAVAEVLYDEQQPGQHGAVAARPLLNVTGLTKSFPGVQALRAVDFDLWPGEVHCLIGENGAGKSTLVKILAGVQMADEGTMVVMGGQVRFASPVDSQNAGIACIFQELNVVDGLTVAENIMLGAEPGRLGFVNRQASESRARALLDSVGFHELDASRPCSRLSSAEKQAVMIAKALRQNARIIIMDEPTSPLEELEVRKLYEVIARLKAAGKGIIYVSHKMREISQLGDRITVFKDGVKVRTLNRGEAGSEDLVRLMVGRQLKEMFPTKDRKLQEVVLRVKGLTGPRVQHIEFELRGGEILGIAGLVGAGRTELLRTIFGADRRIAGEIELDRQPVPPNSIPAAIAAGIALVPEERRSQGIVPMLSVGDNASFVWDEFPKRRADTLNRRDTALRMIRNLAVKAWGLDQRISTLSGGNQQKVVLGKWLSMNTRVVLLDEPTRGVDVGSKREIYRLVDELARQGMGVLLVSSELPELLGLVDRLVVLNNGRIAGELPGNAQEEEVIALSMLHSA